jgi:hypothetical protein
MDAYVFTRLRFCMSSVLSRTRCLADRTWEDFAFAIVLGSMFGPPAAWIDKSHPASILIQQRVEVRIQQRKKSSQQ